MAATKYIINNTAVRIRTRSDPDGRYSEKLKKKTYFATIAPPKIETLGEGRELNRKMSSEKQKV